MKKIYKLYDKDNPDLGMIAKCVIDETLLDTKQTIEIYHEEQAPVLLKLAKDCEADNKVEIFLEDRALPANRMFLDKYCNEHGLDVNSLDDRLKISHGMNYDDNIYIEMEFIYDN